MIIEKLLLNFDEIEKLAIELKIDPILKQNKQMQALKK
jgi:hypothetical protein